MDIIRRPVHELFQVYPEKQLLGEVKGQVWMCCKKTQNSSGSLHSRCNNPKINQDPNLKRDKVLLLSIPGIGDITAAVYLAEVPDVSRFSQAKQLDAYAGLTPGQRESGSSVHGQPHLVKWGNAQLRTAFYALSAYRWNPVIAALHQRMQERGKRG